MSPDERQWANDRAASFAKRYEEETGRSIEVEKARDMLLSTGYRMVDAVSSKGPGGDPIAAAYISKNGGDLFRATVAEYNAPFLYGNQDQSLTAEQRALPASIANPTLGFGIAATLTGGGLAVAVAPRLAAVTAAGSKYAVHFYRAYKADQAGYSVTTAATTGAAVSGAVYTGSAVGLAVLDAYSERRDFSVAFKDRFTPTGLVASATVGGATSIFGTAMFAWAGVANSWKNVTTMPGIVIRGNKFVLDRAAGKAAHGAIDQKRNDK